MATSARPGGSGRSARIRRTRTTSSAPSARSPCSSRRPPDPGDPGHRDRRRRPVGVASGLRRLSTAANIRCSAAAHDTGGCEMSIELGSYVVTDPYFGRPYVDVDEERDTPMPHRYVHGGFEDTSTRFAFSFPTQGYEGRMFNPLSGANGGTEDFFGTMLGEMIGGLSMCFRLGGYMVESNQGHIGDEMDPKAGEDATLYGHRASAEVGRLSK